MFLRTFPSIYRRVETSTPLATLELFEPFTTWFHTLEALSALSAVLVLAGKSGNFQCRFALQTATTSLDSVNAVFTFSRPSPLGCTRALGHSCSTPPAPRRC